MSNEQEIVQATRATVRSLEEIKGILLNLNRNLESTNRNLEDIKKNQVVMITKLK